MNRFALMMAYVGGCVCLVVVIASARADETDDVQQLRDQHMEHPTDGPVDSGPLETTPPLPPDMLSRSGFTSVQVNVDGNGNNIRGDAANEPSIAVDPTNPARIAIGWRQFDNVGSNFRQAGWGYSQDGGQSWTFPGVLERGVFRSDPVLDFDVNGRFYYYSLKSNFCCDMWISDNGGVSWTRSASAFGGDKQWFRIDRTAGIGRGNIYCTWNEYYACTVQDFTRSTDGGQSFSNPQNLPGDPFWGVVSVGPDGAMYISSADAIVVKSTNAQDPNRTPTFNIVGNANLGGFPNFGDGPNPGGLLGQIWLATDHSDGATRGNVYVLGSVDASGSDPLDVMFTRSTNGGASWSSPVRVNDDTRGPNAWQWFGTMAVAPSGRIDAIWNDTRNSQRARISEMFYAYSTDAGQSWSDNIQITPAWDSHIGWPNQNKIGDYYDMISDAGGANVAFAATFNGEQDVYYVRIAPDCNGNGIHDGDDIASGTSNDDNANGIPDECEFDCNAITKFKVRCRNNKLKAKVKSTLPAGTTLTFDNDGDRLSDTVNDNGKAKVKWFGQTGIHIVFVVDCPDLSRAVSCGS